MESDISGIYIFRTFCIRLTIFRSSDIFMNFYFSRRELFQRNVVFFSHVKQRCFLQFRLQLVDFTFLRVFDIFVGFQLSDMIVYKLPSLFWRLFNATDGCLRPCILTLSFCGESNPCLSGVNPFCFVIYRPKIGLSRQ